MDKQMIIDIAAKLIVGLFALYILPKLRELAAAKLDAQQMDDLEKIVHALVRAAEQTLRDGDPTGAKRKAYVCEQLQALNYEVNSEVDALIEAAVYGLPHGKAVK